MKNFIVTISIILMIALPVGYVYWYVPAHTEPSEDDMWPIPSTEDIVLTKDSIGTEIYHNDEVTAYVTGFHKETSGDEDIYYVDFEYEGNTTAEYKNKISGVSFYKVYVNGALRKEGSSIESGSPLDGYSSTQFKLPKGSKWNEVKVQADICYNPSPDGSGGSGIKEQIIIFDKNCFE